MTGATEQALAAINQIQRRAGSQTISTTVDMDILKKEKMFELWFEGSRWADLVRWGDTDRVKLAGQDIPTLYDKFTRAPQDGDKNLIWENGTEENSRFYMTTQNQIGQIGYVDGKHNLFPFPAAEIEINPNLVQNPNW